MLTLLWHESEPVTTCCHSAVRVDPVLPCQSVERMRVSGCVRVIHMVRGTGCIFLFNK